MPALSDWQFPELEEDCLAQITSNVDGQYVYRASERGGTDTVDAGELGLSPTETVITAIRIQNLGARVLINDNNTPVDLGLAAYFDSTGAGADLTLYVQTDVGTGIASVEDTLQTVGGNFAAFSIPSNHQAVFNSLLTAGTEFLFAFARPAAAPASHAGIAADSGGPTASVALRGVLPVPHAQPSIAADTGGPTASMALRGAPRPGQHATINAGVGGPTATVGLRGVRTVASAAIAADAGGPTASMALRAVLPHAQPSIAANTGGPTASVGLRGSPRPGQHAVINVGLGGPMAAVGLRGVRTVASAAMAANAGGPAAVVALRGSPPRGQPSIVADVGGPMASVVLRAVLPHARPSIAIDAGGPTASVGLREGIRPEQHATVSTSLGGPTATVGLRGIRMPASAAIATDAAGPTASVALQAMSADVPANPRAALISYLKTHRDVQALVGQQQDLLSIPLVVGELREIEAQHMPQYAIVITESGGGTTGPGAESYADWENTRMDILCYGKTPYEASNLQRTVHRALKRMTRNVQPAGVLVDATISGGPISGRDPDVDWPFAFASYNVSSYEER